MLFLIPIALCISVIVFVILSYYDVMDEDIAVAFIVGSIIGAFISAVLVIAYYSCPNCDELCTGDYCTKCGAEMHPENRKMNCPNCNAVCKYSDSYCGNCGYVLKEDINNN